MAPATFSANTSLLNPKFDGYKLKILEQSDCVRTFALPAPGVTQSTVSGRRIVPFTEVSARIKHNHLKAGISDDEFSYVAYVDQDGGVMMVMIDNEQTPTFCKVFEIPQEIGRSNDEHKEYPVVLSISLYRWLASDGHGRFYVFTFNKELRAPVSAQHTFELVDQTGALVPCRLLHVREAEAGLMVLVTRRDQNTSSSSDVKSKTTYELVSLRLDIQNNQTKELWVLSGSSLPADVQFDTTNNAYIVSSASPFESPGNSEPPVPEPTRDEIAPIPRANENLDSAQPNLPPPPPHAYSWTQTDDSVTIMFPLPSTTTTSAIRITISRLHLTLAIISGSSSSIPIPKYAQCAWWAEVDPGASLWTWERAPDERQSNVGLLTIHLEKKHIGTRWSHVFAPSTGEPDVPETLDPSELASIREALEKYTTELAGDGSSMPSLANPDADEELDAPGQVGQRVIVQRIDALSGSTHVDQRDISMLSTPLLMIDPSAVPSLIVRRDIDGLLFHLEPTASWTHVSTYSALSFVLASKRDTRFVVHYKDQLVLAFESGSTHGTGNAYLYRGQPTKSQWGQQSILSVSSQATGALLGVAAVQSTSGAEMAICCLCERQLVLLQKFM
ncbi:CS domain-containing protein [Ceratobasidium sp. AG-Ba]|nr:CS domain-containing protein [Ceratobasidium sp. AG-Ba]